MRARIRDNLAVSGVIALFLGLFALGVLGPWRSVGTLLGLVVGGLVLLGAGLAVVGYVAWRRRRRGYEALGLLREGRAWNGIHGGHAVSVRPGPGLPASTLVELHLPREAPRLFVSPAIPEAALAVALRRFPELARELEAHVPTGDAAFDARFHALAGMPEAVPALLDEGFRAWALRRKALMDVRVEGRRLTARILGPSIEADELAEDLAALGRLARAAGSLRLERPRSS